MGSRGSMHLMSHWRPIGSWRPMGSWDLEPMGAGAMDFVDSCGSTAHSGCELVIVIAESMGQDAAKKP